MLQAHSLEVEVLLAVVGEKDHFGRESIAWCAVGEARTHQILMSRERNGESRWMWAGGYTCQGWGEVGRLHLLQLSLLIMEQSRLIAPRLRQAQQLPAQRTRLIGHGIPLRWRVLTALGPKLIHHTVELSMQSSKWCSWIAHTIFAPIPGALAPPVIPPVPTHPTPAIAVTNPSRMHWCAPIRIPVRGRSRRRGGWSKRLKLHSSCGGWGGYAASQRYTHTFNDLINSRGGKDTIPRLY